MIHGIGVEITGTSVVLGRPRKGSLRDKAL